MCDMYKKGSYMKNMNKFLLVFWFCYATTIVEASMQNFLPSFMNNQSSKIYVIDESHENDDGQDLKSIISGETKELSDKSLVETIKDFNQTKNHEFLDAFRKNNVQDLLSLLNEDTNFRLNNAEHHEDVIIPFYIADNRKDLFVLKYDLPFEVHQRLIAAGGGLTTNGYKLLHDFELESAQDGISIEQHLRALFVHAVMDGNIDLVQTLCDIDTCLRYQDFLEYENRFQYGPLISATFDDNMTGLHFAVVSNNLDVVNFFIKNKVSINARSNLKIVDLDNSESYQPLTPLDYAIVQRQHFNDNGEKTPMDGEKDMINNSKIIDMLIASKANLESFDNKIASLIHAYMSEKLRKPTMQRRLTLYASIKNLLAPNSAKIIPV